MAKKTRKKLPKLEQIKKKIQGKVYVGDGVKEMQNKIDSLEVQKQKMQLELEIKQQEIDSLKQVVKVRVK